MASIIKVDQIQTASGGTPTAADLGLNTTGNVLQVVQTVNTTEQAVTSTAYTTVNNMSFSITPSSTSSKILILINLNLEVYRNSAAPSNHQMRVYRDGSVIVNKHHDHYAGVASNSYRSLDADGTVMFLDSPGTTSSVTYSIAVKSNDAADLQTVRVSNNSTTSTITLMEIAG